MPDGLRLGAAREALAAQIGVLEDGRRARIERTFYDTFDGRLHEAGLALLHADGRLALVRADAYGERASAAFEESPARLFAGDLPEGRLRELVGSIVEVRALTPIARTRSQSMRLRVLNGNEKTVARLVVESSTANGPGRSRMTLRSRVYVVPVRGYEKAAERLRETLEGKVGLTPALVPLHDEAAAASGGTPGGVPGKLDIPLRPDMRADAAAVEVLQHLQGAIQANLPGTLADVDTEFLHDLRVAVRRTRALQRELKDVFPPEQLARFREGFRWLQAITGPTRDLDVYLLDFSRFRTALPEPAASDLDALEQLLVEERRREQRRMARALRSAKATTLLAGWAAFVEGLVELRSDERPDAERKIGDLAGERIRAVYRRMVKMGGRIEDSSPAVALHDLRKKGKELRYLLEFFAVLYPADVVRPMVKTMKALQDTLGRFQDFEVQAGMLRAHRESIVEREGGAAALMAMGSLVDHLERDQAAARSEFAERFAAFAEPHQRELVDEAFR